MTIYHRPVSNPHRGRRRKLFMSISIFYHGLNHACSRVGKRPSITARPQTHIVGGGENFKFIKKLIILFISSTAKAMFVFEWAGSFTSLFGYKPNFFLEEKKIFITYHSRGYVRFLVGCNHLSLSDHNPLWRRRRSQF